MLNTSQDIPILTTKSSPTILSNRKAYRKRPIKLRKEHRQNKDKESKKCTWICKYGQASILKTEQKASHSTAKVRKSDKSQLGGGVQEHH
jgi:hypothetical protein